MIVTITEPCEFANGALAEKLRESNAGNRSFVASIAYAVFGASVQRDS